jgi:3,4-dihydroxy 2-butanone 4-phosphate synthase/GTP cyclohydrolase II
MKKKFCNIEKLIGIARKGKIFILVDDESRENEGDLVFLANKCSPEKINFMAKFGRGLICLALDKKQSNKLGLKLMSNSNGTRFSTAFTVSIEAKKGVTTGISAYDRSKTVLTAVKQKSSAKDIVTPGHIFPLVAKEGGVLTRAGHTEASVDIARIASNSSGAVICEIMNDDGSMSKRDQLFKFAKKNKIKFKNTYLNENIFVNQIDRQKHLVFSSANLNSFNCKVRVLSLKQKDKKKNIFKVSDVSRSLNYLRKYDNFALIIIQDFMMNDIQSNIKFLNTKKEMPSNLIRNYGVGAQIIKKMNLNNIILVTKSKKRIVGLDGFGIKIKKQEIFK